MGHNYQLHELTMTRTLSEASGLFEVIDFCLSGMMNILTAVTNFIYLFYHVIQKALLAGLITTF